MINENQRLDYLHQLGVVSWMPRQPLPGARPSEYFYHEAPRQDSPLSRLRQRSDVPQTEVAQRSGVRAEPPEIPSGQPAATSGPAQAAARPPQADVLAEDPMDAVADHSRVNRVPEHLQLAFIRQQGDRPLIVSHFGEQGDSEQLFLPMVQSMLQLCGYPEPLISLPFVWPLAGMPAACREQEFVQVFQALLGGARLGCQPQQTCWWFGELPELIAESEGLLNIELHHPVSLTRVMSRADEKRALLYRLLDLKKG